MTRRDIQAMMAGEIRKVLIDVLEAKHERWVSGEELTKQCSMFTKDWLKHYGQSLPRTRAVVTDENGEVHKTSWSYPLHKIQRMIQEGGIGHLTCRQSEEIVVMKMAM